MLIAEHPAQIPAGVIRLRGRLNLQIWKFFALFPTRPSREGVGVEE
jgi:hypothetical protein